MQMSLPQQHNTKSQRNLLQDESGKMCQEKAFFTAPSGMQLCSVLHVNYLGTATGKTAATHLAEHEAS